MGFFKDMGLINKVYKHLKAIESIIYTSNGALFRQREALQIHQHLKELIEISNKGNRTIDYADFVFIGHKNRLREIIYAINNILTMHGWGSMCCSYE